MNIDGGPFAVQISYGAFVQFERHLQGAINGFFDMCSFLLGKEKLKPED